MSCQQTSDPSNVSCNKQHKQNTRRRTRRKEETNQGRKALISMPSQHRKPTMSACIRCRQCLAKRMHVEPRRRWRRRLFLHCILILLPSQPTFKNKQTGHKNHLSINLHNYPKSMKNPKPQKEKRKLFKKKKTKLRTYIWLRK